MCPVGTYVKLSSIRADRNSAIMDLEKVGCLGDHVLELVLLFMCVWTAGHSYSSRIWDPGGVPVQCEK